METAYSVDCGDSEGILDDVFLILVSAERSGLLLAPGCVQVSSPVEGGHLAHLATKYKSTVCFNQSGLWNVPAAAVTLFWNF